MIGIAFALVGVVLIAYSDFRHRDVQAALARGEYASLSNRAAILFAGVGAKLGLTTIVRLVLRT